MSSPATVRAPSAPAAEPWGPVDGLWMAGLALLGLALLGAARAVLDAQGLALGGDAVLWGLTAKNLQDGFVVSMNPGYPMLVAMVEGLRGASLVEAGLWVSAAASAAVGPAVWWASRSLGARRRFAAAAAAATLLVPRVTLFGLQIQPDAWTMVALLVGVPLLRHYVERPGWGRLLPLALWAAWAVLLREHTLLASALVGIVVVLRAQHPRRAAAFGTTLLAVALLAPLLAGQRPGPPWRWTWAERMFLPLRGDERPRLPHSDAEVAFDASHRAAHAQGDRAAIVSHHARYALAQSPAGWGTLALATLAALSLGRGRRAAAWVPMLTPLPGLLILSQDRHVLVLMPVALATLGAAASQAGPRGLLARLGLIGATCAHLATLGDERDEARTRLADARLSRADGMALCAARGPEDLIEGGYPTLLLYCPTRRLGQPALNGSAAEWHTWGLGVLGPGWEQSNISLSTNQLYRLAPALTGPARPCATSRPTRPHPWLVFAAADGSEKNHNEQFTPWDPTCSLDPMSFSTP